jgi:hypothetical protein
MNPSEKGPVVELKERKAKASEALKVRTTNGEDRVQSYYNHTVLKGAHPSPYMSSLYTGSARPRQVQLGDASAALLEDEFLPPSLQ